jgi:GTP-binding protein HflX
VVVLNKADLADDAPVVAGREGSGGVLRRDDRYALKVSALSGAGIPELRDMMGTVLAELWSEVDLAVPYSAGELLARVRERGTVEFEYRDEDVRVWGRVPPAMAGDLHTEAAAWERALRARKANE